MQHVRDEPPEGQATQGALGHLGGVQDDDLAAVVAAVDQDAGDVARVLVGVGLCSLARDEGRLPSRTYRSCQVCVCVCFFLVCFLNDQKKGRF